MVNSDIATASIGPRSTVATGPEEIQASKWEFEADTERFIQTAEVRLVTLYAGKGLMLIKLRKENRLPIRLDYVQYPRTSTQLPLWWNGKSGLYICYPNCSFGSKSNLPSRK